MKFRTTAIAMAVAGVVAAPVAVQAGADEIYASARVGAIYTDTSDVADFEVKSFASRFGMRGETDLGNGLTGFGRYEVSMDMNGSGSTITNRHRYVGLKGDWGSILAGQTYHTWYNFVSGPLDIPWWHSLGADILTQGRTDNAITYAGGGGAISFGVTGYFLSDGEETAPDAFEAAISFGLGDSTLGFGISSVDEDGAKSSQGSTGDDEDVVGVTWSGIGIGDTSLAVGFQAQDDDTSVALHWDIGNFYVNASMLSMDATDQDMLDATLGYTQSLGRKTTMYYEVNTMDKDTGDSDDDYMAVMAVLKYDII